VWLLKICSVLNSSNSSIETDVADDDTPVMAS